MTRYLAIALISLSGACTPAVPPGTAVQRYAVEHERLHPAACDFLRKFGIVENPETIRVLIRSRLWPPFSMSGRGSPAPAFVIGERMYFAEGVLNYPGSLWDTTFDLSTAAGAAKFSHEARHVDQFRQNGAAWLVWQYAKTLFLSWKGKRAVWDHNASEFEQAAMKIEEAVFHQLLFDSSPLEPFKELQE